MSKKRDGDDNEDEEMYRESDLNTVTIHINDLIRKSNNLTPSKPIIFEVDDRLRGVNQKDYEPKIVSIGPIHHEKKQVKSMEQHKVRLLQELLAERKDLTLEKLIEEVRKVELDARKCYSSKSINLNNGDDFVLTMILDGCFIIQLMRYYSRKKSADPIFESKNFIQIIHDLLLFENQLPFLVLTTLFNEIKTGNPKDNLRHLILLLVEDIVPWLDESNMVHPPEPKHLLGLVYGCISIKIPPKAEKTLVQKITRLVQKITRLIRCPNICQLGARVSPKKTPVLDIHRINSAFELQVTSGIHLRRSKDSSITFASKILRVPPLNISGETEAFLRNLMAYEQLQLNYYHRRCVTDYVYFLQCLARSTGDVEILRYSGIINNFLGGDHMIIRMLERLGTHFIRSPDFTYFDVFVSLNEFCSHRWNGWMANLVRTHFNTPWSMIKFGTGLLVLAITVAQLTFAALSYFKKDKRG